MGWLADAGVVSKPAVLLDAAEEALDAVSLLIEGLVVGVLSLAVALGRDDGIAALVDDLLEQLVSVVGLVGENIFGGHAVDQIASGGHVVLLTWSEEQANRQAQGVYTDMELGSEAAARAAKRLGVQSPFFAARQRLGRGPG